MVVIVVIIVIVLPHSSIPYYWLVGNGIVVIIVSRSSWPGYISDHKGRRQPAAEMGSLNMFGGLGLGLGGCGFRFAGTRRAI